MAIDGGIAGLLREHITGGAHLQRIETTTGLGVPDLNYCIDGVEGWAELKATTGWAVTMRREQVAWIGRRTRAGGRVVVMVRQKSAAMKRDALWVVRGSAVEWLAERGLPREPGEQIVYRGEGGPRGWDWLAVRRCLTS